MRRVRTILGLSLLLSTPAWAADPPLPAPVAKALKEQTDMCTEAGGKPSAIAAVKRTDLNDDGKQDFVLDVGAIDCTGAASIFGDREKSVQAFTGDGADGAAPVFSGSAYAVKLEGKAANAKVWLTLSGAGCGDEKAKFFAEESFCDRPLVWNAQTRKVELAPVSAAKVVR